MYSVGFGDAFMIVFPGAAKPLRVLVDCGTIANGPHSMADVVGRIVEDARDPDGIARIDVIVATHRHKDHVSGFARAEWAHVNVREVWMPWTEAPTDSVARAFRNRQHRLAMHLSAALGVSDEGSAESSQEWNDPRHHLALNALSNDAAMTTLHQGFAGAPTRRFLPTLDGESILRSASLPGVTVNILGPSRSGDVIRDMDPPAAQSYLAMVDDTEPGKIQIPQPFPESWWLTGDSATLSSEDRRVIQAVGKEGLNAALVALDKAVNGTSLFLVFQIGRACLAFPGDAQWGTWKAALENPEHAALLRRTTFYKIGHHGSHNATPVGFVEQLPQDFWAMASVRPIQKWPEIPRGPLMQELGRRTAKIVRADRLARAVPGFTISKDKMTVEARIPID